MSFPKLEVGDLVMTNTWTGEQIVEIVQYRGETGQLLYVLYHPDGVLKSRLERFVKDTDAFPYSMHVVHKVDKELYLSVLASVHNAQKAKND